MIEIGMGDEERGREGIESGWSIWGLQEFGVTGGSPAEFIPSGSED
jgi:hypothetical protein